MASKTFFFFFPLCSSTAGRRRRARTRHRYIISCFRVLEISGSGLIYSRSIEPRGAHMVLRVCGCLNYADGQKVSPGETWRIKPLFANSSSVSQLIICGYTSTSFASVSLHTNKLLNFWNFNTLHENIQLDQADYLCLAFDPI